ncbi:MAG: glycosyltransferase family 8 protein [Alphaproteobacteria bacterium]|nr:glycosyltransferase family 8 protein [Alphaproteobacteria bacterium]
MKQNAIVLCCTANWLPYAAVTLQSCAEHGAAEMADFHVLVLGASGRDHARFAAFASSRGFAATLTDVTLPPGLAQFPADRFSPAALIRLNLDALLPDGYHRVLYLDSDILALGPVADIFAADLGGKALGAVEDYESLPGLLGRRHIGSIGLGKDQPYFNSGVMLFDWPRTRERAHLPRSVVRISKAMREGQKLRLPDQDVLNLEFAGDWQRLDLRFNLMAFFVDYFPAPAVFRHFSNKQKPWGKLWQPGFAPYRDYYRETFLNSPWPEFAPGKCRGLSFEGTGGILLRKLDPISGRRYHRHLQRT